MVSTVIGVVPDDVRRTLSGLQFLRGILDGTLPRPPIGALMDFEMVTIEDGHTVFEGRPGPQHGNPIGTVHGSFAAALMDSCMSCAVQTRIPAGMGYTTLEFKISLLRAITPETGVVRAEGRALHVGRRTGTAEGWLRDGTGKLLVHGTTTCLVFPL